MRLFADSAFYREIKNIDDTSKPERYKDIGYLGWVRRILGFRLGVG